MNASFRKNLLTGSLILFLYSVFYFFAIGDFLPYDEKGDFQKDGRIYADLAKRLPEMIENKEITSYYVQRIVPSAIVHYMIKGVGAAFTNANVFTAFYIFNALVLWGIFYFYLKISQVLKLNQKTIWLGFMAVFLTLAIGKYSFYYPNLTDMTTHLLGFAMLYFYLSSNPVGLILVSVLGAFTWPTLLVYGLLLFVLPRQIALNRTPDSRYRFVVAGLVTAFIFGILYVAEGNMLKRLLIDQEHYVVGFGTHPVNTILLPLSFVFLILFVYYFFLYLLKDVSLNQFHVLKNRNVWLRGIIAFAVLAGTMYLQKQTGGAQKGVSFKSFLVLTFVEPLLEPGITFVSHLLYAGAGFLLVAFFWKNVCRNIQFGGLGIFILVLINFIFYLPCESRNLLPLMPIFIMYGLQHLNKFRINTTAFWTFTFSAFVLSKIWLPIGNNMDLFSMNAGPWIPDRYYLPIVLASLAITAVFYFGFIRQLRPATSNKQESSPEPEMGTGLAETLA